MAYHNYIKLSVPYKQKNKLNNILHHKTRKNMQKHLGIMNYKSLFPIINSPQTFYNNSQLTILLSIPNTHLIFYQKLKHLIKTGFSSKQISFFTTGLRLRKEPNSITSTTAKDANEDLPHNTIPSKSHTHISSNNKSQNNNFSSVNKTDKKSIIIITKPRSNNEDITHHTNNSSQQRSSPKYKQ